MDSFTQLEFQIDLSGIRRSFRAMGEGLKNMKAPLKEFSQYLKEKLEKKMASQGDGTWPDYAESTKKRREAMGTGKMTKFGNVRATHLKKLVTYEKFLKAKAKQEEAETGDVSEATFDKLVGLQNKIQKLREQKEKVRAKTFKQRKVRKALASKTNMLGKLKRLQTKITKNSVKIGLLSGPEWAWRHNEGDGPIPKRQIVPETLDNEDVNKLIECLEAHAVEVFENPPTMLLEGEEG